MYELLVGIVGIHKLLTRHEYIISIETSQVIYCWKYIWSREMQSVYVTNRPAKCKAV